MDLENLQQTIEVAIDPQFRGRLLDRGQARSMIWRDGVLPAGAPNFAPTLSYDLLSYGTSLLSLALRLREQGGNEALACSAFEKAGEAIKSVVSKGNSKDPQSGFYRFLAACAFHLGHLSARAYSMLSISIQNANLSRMEKALALLILRQLNELENEITDWCSSNIAEDYSLAEELNTKMESHGFTAFEDDLDMIIEVLDTALTDNFYKGFAIFLLALQVGEIELVKEARNELRKGLDQCSELNLVPQWWCFRIAIYLIDDLWNSSFHNVLPYDIPNGDVESWQSLRHLFIALLFKRKERAEIELWPSQIEAARRAVDTSDNLVVSLPTSAGKTRIAELCILRCFSEGKRVLFVTPLRALSAQTEVSLRSTFGPLGKKISALYGSIGISGFEGDVFKDRDIVVSTPEKLDFALRNDPTILDNVGLIILDEGHMIGFGEREIRYEVQIQRLLKRENADQRRIVCLSAVFPKGEELDDFVAWLRRDEEGGAVVCEWRPTRIRFGEVVWLKNYARLNLHVDKQKSFIPEFFKSKKSTFGRRRNPFPINQRELVLATSWQLVKEGQSVLIYCPLRISVETLSRSIVDLAPRGLLENVLETNHYNKLETILAIGREWLGEEHPILKCLKLGVAVHHGALPTPFRKEMERLLRDRIFKITVSSPTLAQGLNLTATTIVMHSLDRDRKLIKDREFKNIIGRAGRAFTDIEGLVVYPMFDKHRNRRKKWSQLIALEEELEMESGIVKLVKVLLKRLSEILDKTDIAELQEYILNNATAWDFHAIEREDEKDQEKAKRNWRKYLARLDTVILGLLGDQDLQVDEIATQLDDVLASSLWQRRLARSSEQCQDLFRSGLISRAKVIWANSTASQRKGYFLAGVGFETGQYLDSIAKQANMLLLEANAGILMEESDSAIESITNLAELLFQVHPFIPDPFPSNWRDILHAWLKGDPIIGVGDVVTSESIRFIENGLIYKLTWGMEAVRVRAQANTDNINEDSNKMTVDDLEFGFATPAVETGTLNRCATILIQAGFVYRIAAIKAVTDSDASFNDSFEFKEWLNSDIVDDLSKDTNWPTPETHMFWLKFLKGHTPIKRKVWEIRRRKIEVIWREDVVPKQGEYVMIKFSQNRELQVLSKRAELLGCLKADVTNEPEGIITAQIGVEDRFLDCTYIGPDDCAFLSE